MPEFIDLSANDFVPGGGAQFWGYISGMRNTSKVVTHWRINVRHKGSGWMGVIISDGYPHGEMLKAPHLSGEFAVEVIASGPGFSETRLELLDDPTIPHNPGISCRENNAGMIGIVADEDGKGAKYWTISNAY